MFVRLKLALVMMMPPRVSMTYIPSSQREDCAKNRELLIGYNVNFNVCLRFEKVFYIGHIEIALWLVDDQSCKMSKIWQIYLCKNIEKLG